MITNKKELKNKQTIKYLEEIFLYRHTVHTHPELNIPGFGKITAKPKSLYHIGEKEVSFHFVKGERGFGTFSREQTGENYRYYISYDPRGRQQK